MNQQATIEFPIHSIENNKDSQKHLDDNRKRYSKQCRELLEVMKQGVPVTGKWAQKNLDIFHLPRRILDLKEAGFKIETTRIEGGFSQYKLVS